MRWTLTVMMFLGATPVFARDLQVHIAVGKFAVESGLFNTLFAKELCTCMFVDGLSIDECKARDNLPSAAHLLVNLKPGDHTLYSEYKKTINVILKSLQITGVTAGPPASAHYVDARHGCVLDNPTVIP